MGGDSNTGDGHSYGVVSIHASTWEATDSKHLSKPQFYCFNPRLHMGGDIRMIVTIIIVNVSIHASTWEATPSGNTSKVIIIVSIHASTWEATPRRRRSGSPRSCFNPRLHMGGDKQVDPHQARRKSFQSTPPHGRRRIAIPTGKSFTSRFNPRLHMGGDYSFCDPCR